MNKNQVVAEVRTKAGGKECTLKLKHLDLGDTKFVLEVLAKLDLLKKVKIDEFYSSTLKATVSSYGIPVSYLKPKKDKENKED